MLARIEAPIVANQTLAAASAIFSWAIKQEILTVNPCKGVDRNPTNDRERVLSDCCAPQDGARPVRAQALTTAEVALLWPRLEPALKLLLLTGQRPGEVAAMQAVHIAEGWWQMPGRPAGAWPGTKNGRDHRVAGERPDIAEVQPARPTVESIDHLPGLLARSADAESEPRLLEVPDQLVAHAALPRAHEYVGQLAPRRNRRR